MNLTRVLTRFLDLDDVPEVGPTEDGFLFGYDHGSGALVEVDPATIGVTDHGALSGLGDVEDHPDFLLLDGSRAMTSDLVLSGDPTDPEHAARKAYVDSGDAIVAAYVDAQIAGIDLSAYLPLAGGTMTGDLILAGDPDAALKAATKQYVDLFMPITGGTFSGDISRSSFSVNSEGRVFARGWQHATKPGFSFTGATSTGVGQHGGSTVSLGLYGGGTLLLQVQGNPQYDVRISGGNLARENLLVEQNAGGDADITIGTIDDSIGLYATAPVVQAAAMTASDTNSPNSGDATTDAIIENLQSRVDELEAMLSAAAGGIGVCA